MQPRFDAPAEHADALPTRSDALSALIDEASSVRHAVGRERIVRRRIKRYVDALPDDLLDVDELADLPGFSALCRSVSPPQPQRAPQPPAPAPTVESVPPMVESVVTVLAPSVDGNADEKASIAAVPAEPIVSVPDPEPDSEAPVLVALPAPIETPEPDAATAVLNADVPEVPVAVAVVPEAPTVVAAPVAPEVPAAPVAAVLGAAGKPVVPVVPVIPAQVAMRTTRSTAPKPASDRS